MGNYSETSRNSSVTRNATPIVFDGVSIMPPDSGIYISSLVITAISGTEYFIYESQFIVNNYSIILPELSSVNKKTTGASNWNVSFAIVSNFIVVTITGDVTNTVTWNGALSISENYRFSSGPPSGVYLPSVLSDWSGTDPLTVSNALDRIASKITPIP